MYTINVLSLTKKLPQKLKKAANIKLSGAVAWGIMAKPPRVNASERPKGVVFSALLEAEPVPLVCLKN